MIAFMVVVSSLIALSASQYQKPSKDAAILSEARYLAVNGQFGSTYKQEDGIDFKEESDNEGNRKGSYSYIDPSGQRRTVTYTAGKDGFRATGDHLPVAAPVAPVAPAVPSVPASVPSSVSSGQYSGQHDDGQYHPESDYQYQYRESSEPTNPPQFQYNPNPQVYQAQSQYNPPAQPQYNPQAQPQYNPLQFQYQSPAVASGPVVSAGVPNYNDFTTEPPHRFFPPGKLSLNRSPDGFSYTFNKV